MERPVEAKVHRGYAAPKWVWTWYTIVCIYWIFDGVFLALMGAGVFSNRTSFLDVVIGALLAVIGLGMLFRVRFLRGIAHFLCWVALFFGVIGIGVMLTVGTLAFGPLAFIFVIFSVIRVAISAFMIYLIGETESHYPT